jgi:hypothetical protein
VFSYESSAKSNPKDSDSVLAGRTKVAGVTNAEAAVAPAARTRKLVRGAMVVGVLLLEVGLLNTWIGAYIATYSLLEPREEDRRNLTLIYVT